MSYVVCSNIESEDNVSVGGYADPSSFLNSFRSPLILEVDSEIAVESVKIDRSSNWDIKDNNNFFLYFGLEQSVALPCGQTTKNGVRIVLRPGSYDVKEMALELTRAINTAPIGPEIFGTCVVATTSDATTKKFAGFTFTFKPPRVGPDIAVVDAAVLPAVSVPGTLLEASNFDIGNEGAIREEIGLGNPVFTFTPYNSVGPIITTLTNEQATQADADLFTTPTRNLMRSNCSIRQRGNPLSAADGKLVVQFRTQLLTNAESWCIGLSRASTPYVNNAFPTLRNSAGGNVVPRSQRTYMDYWVQWDAVDDVLKVFQWKQQNNGAGGQPIWNVDEINYNDGPNTSVPGGQGSPKWNDASLNTANIDRVIFKISGNELIIELSDAAGGAGIKFLVNSARTATLDKSFMFPALSNETDTLFPTFVMTTENQEMRILKYNANNLIANGWKDISQTNVLLNAGNRRPNGTARIVAGSDWYSNLTDVRIYGEMLFNAERPSLVVSKTGINGSAPVTTYPAYTHATTVLPYLPALIMGDEPADPPRVPGGNISDYLRPFYVIPLPENNPNMSGELGFGRWPVAGPVDFVTNTGTEQTITSIESAFYTVHSAFIRINDLPIQSYNGATSSRSNILYHIPRFSNDGRQSGELFFNAPEKTYIKLNNTQKIMLNQLQVDIVGRNERVVGDLVGSTIVCLHIRKAR